MGRFTRRSFLPVSNVQPFTYRDTLTFLELLNNVEGQFENLRKDLSTVLDNGAHIANLVNDRVGEVKPIILDSRVKREQDLAIPAEMPGDHNFWVVWFQNENGTGRVHVPPAIEGTFPDPGAGGTVFVHVMPLGEGRYRINDPADLTKKLLEPVNDWIRTIDEREKETTKRTDAKIVEEKRIAKEAVEAVKTLLGVKEGELRQFTTSKIAESESRERARAEGVEGGLRRDVTTNQGSITQIQNRLGQLDGLDSELKTAVEQTLPQRIAQETQARERAVQDVQNSLRGKAEKKWLPVNVREAPYNAVGNGVADDTAAIQAAADAAGKDGHIYIPKGVYRVTGTLRFPLGCRVEGSSWNSDSLSPRNLGDNQGANSQSTILVDGANTGIHVARDRQCSIENLRVDSATPGRGTGMLIECSSMTMENVAISGFAEGMRLNEVWYGKLTNVSIFRCDKCVHVNYCYNLTFNDIRCYPLKANKQFGIGMYLDNRSMVTLNGGSMEDYRVGIWLKASASVIIQNMYFESIQDEFNSGPFTVCTLDSNTINTTVVATGNQVYMDSHDAFIDMAKTPAGERLVAFGNHFKIGDTQPVGTGICYKWNQNNGPRIGVTLVGDSMIDAQNKCKYIPDIAFAPMGSLIIPPVGVNAQSQGYGASDKTIIGGGLHITSHLDVNGVIPHLYLTPLEGALPQASSMPGWQGKYVGAMAFSKTHNKPVWWTGNGWVDATGTARA